MRYRGRPNWRSPTGRFRSTGFGVAILVAIANGCESDREQSAAVGQSVSAEEVLNECRATIARKRVEYDDLMSERHYWPAALRMRSAMSTCVEALNDPTLLALVVDAEIKYYVEDINSPNTAPRVKIHAIDALMRDYPEEGKKYATQRERLVTAAEKRDKQVAAEEAARRKREGVRIGMTKEEVLASSWGKPSSVRKTTTADEKTEFWCYHEYCDSSLYFVDGVLTVINN